ncbi:MAG: phenylalanine--tRNA ligase subunit beta [Chlamydiia bacterium]
MKVPLDWLKEFVDIDDIPVKDLADLMTIRGLEVDAFDETHMEVSQTPDLGYTRSLLGVARFLRQLLDRKVRMPKIGQPHEKGGGPKIVVDSYAEKVVPKYATRSVKGIHNGPAPDWMQHRLKAAGMTPKNLIVDVTNYVQMALGQPMHAFDEDCLESTVHVRLTTKPENFTTLLDTEIEIKPDTIVIATAQGIEAVAGIIGSKKSAVSDTTTNVLLESAQFSSQSIRRAAKSLKISTPSSQRFENTTDPMMVEIALDYATDLLVTYGKGRACVATHHSSKQLTPHKATLHLKRVEELLGIETSIEELKEVMEKIDVEVLEETASAIKVQLPFYRTDLSSEIDLIEEVIKILGFERLIEKSTTISLSEIPTDPFVEFKRYVRKKLLQQGLTEMMTPSLINKEYLLSPDASIEVKNALSDRSVLRTTHLYGAIESVLHNQNHSSFFLEGFEIGTVYYKEGLNFKESQLISVTIENDKSDFLDLKGVFETLFHQLHIEQFNIIPSHLPHLHPYRQGTLEVRGHHLGTIGEIHPALLKKFGIKKRVYFGEILMDVLLHNTPKTFHIHPICNFPAIERDTTFTLKKSISYGFLEALIETHRPKLLQTYSFKGIYDPDKNGPSHNLTMHWVFRSFERSLTQEEVEKSMLEFTSKLNREINS